jgi:hypothetical protein
MQATSCNAAQYTRLPNGAYYIGTTANKPITPCYNGLILDTLIYDDIYRTLWLCIDLMLPMMN